MSKYRKSKLECIQCVANTLVRVYGSTLKDYGTDVDMAKAVVRALGRNLLFEKAPYKRDKKRLEAWAKRRDPMEKSNV